MAPSDTPQFCPSRAVQVRPDGSWFVATCARPYGHDNRPHRNGIAREAGSWTDEEGLESIEFLLSRFIEVCRGVELAIETLDGGRSHKTLVASVVRDLKPLIDYEPPTTASNDD